MRDETVTFRLPEDIRAALEAYGKAQDLTLSQIMRKVLKEFLSKVKQ